MPELSEEQVRRRRKNAAAHVAAGGLMVGGAAATAEHMRQKTGVKSTSSAIREIARTKKVLPKHGQHAATWLGTRGVAAAGVPLAAIGAKNLLSPRPKNVGRLDIQDDVIQESVDRTAPINRRSDASKKARLAEIGTVTAGATGGGLAGGALGRKAPGRLRLLGVGVGTAAGATGGAVAAAPLGRKAVRRSTGGEYSYSTERGTYKVRKSGISKLDPGDAAINTLARHEQKQLVRRKRKQSTYSLASAGLGATALGLKAPALARFVARKVPKAPGAARLGRHAPKADSMATNVGIGSLGVGSLGSLNFARIQRAETKADERSSNALKPVKKAMKLPDGSWVRLRSLRGFKGHPDEPPYNRVEAMHRNKNIGYLTLHRDSGRVEHVKTADEWRRKGVASAMWNRAEQSGMKPKHAWDAQSAEGRAWALGHKKVKKAHLHGDRDRSVDVAKAMSAWWSPEYPEGRRKKWNPRVRESLGPLEPPPSKGPRLYANKPDRPQKRSRIKGVTASGTWHDVTDPDQVVGDMKAYQRHKSAADKAYARRTPPVKWNSDRQRREWMRKHNPEMAMSKALLPALKTFKRPPRFAGVKVGGLRRYTNPYTGQTRQVAYRGSVG